VRRGGAVRSVPARDVAAERWLAILLLAGLAALGIGLIEPSGSRTDAPGPARPLTMAQARASNAAVPIRRNRWRRAEPYRSVGGTAERAQAVDCLATAALYEAGDDVPGQRAVIQVVLNRARAPGFPRTICGVVYQGYARATGCQFSFTCDGSFQRRPIRVGWTSARTIARRALAGRVYAPVGRATDYHADWVVPYWRDTLQKVARVGPHLFYVRR